MTAGQEAVLVDVLTYSGGTVREIAERTGFVQSHISASVAKLHERGLATTSTDPVDRRRTRVEASAEAVAVSSTRAARDIGPALRAAVGTEHTTRTLALLDELAGLLLAPPD